MSKILLVQPYKVLQHALVVALFPEHQVKIVEKLPTDWAAEDADLAIIDAVALRGKASTMANEIRAPENWRLPILWIDSETSTGNAPSKLHRLAPPLTKEELRTAVAELLRAQAPSAEASHDEAHFPAPRGAKAAMAGADKVGGDKNIIELVDVFDEAAERGGEGASASRRD
jgi:hypothetical protein